MSFPRHAVSRRASLRLEPLEARANPSTLTVDDDGQQTNNKADFSTIQAAVNAASPGDRIVVYAGTYNEQVVIPATKDDLTLTASKAGGGGSQNDAIIAPTSFADPTEAVVRVAGADDVEIRGFTITGASAPIGTGAGANYGVLVDGGGSATIRDNRITSIRDLPLTGTQEGIGVQFGLTDGKGGIVSTGSGEIRQNQIDDYQKGGVVVIGAGSDASVRQNVITGVGPTDVIGQNGVQVSNGATADVRQNVISGNNFTPGTFVSEGVLVYLTSGVTVRDNTLFDNNEGVLLFQASGNLVENNTARDNTLNGIGVFDADDNVIRRNVASGNGQDGINLDDASGNLVENNFAFLNGRYGIALESNATDNVVQRNHVRDNKAGGIFVGNPDNVVRNNHG